MHPFDLTGKTAIITGSATGIGRAIARGLAQHGAAVELIDLNADALSAAIDALKAEGLKAAGERCDVSDAHMVAEAFHKIYSRHSKVDILVNNAGVAHVGNALNTSPEDFERIMKINVGSVANCSRVVLEHMVDKGGGVILNIASVVAQFGFPDRFAYSASKGAVLTMTYSIAQDFLKDNIRCNAILPGRVHTEFVDGFIAKNYAGKEAEMFDKLSKAQPIGRMGKPEEIAGAAVFLCSDEASFITGSAYPVDGGTLTLR